MCLKNSQSENSVNELDITIQYSYCVEAVLSHGDQESHRSENTSYSHAESLLNCYMTELQPLDERVQIRVLDLKDAVLRVSSN